MDALRFFSANASRSYNMPVSDRMFSELPSYHLNAESLAIFSEQLSDLQMLRQVNSQTSLLRSSYRSSIFSQRPSENPSKGRSSSSASKTNQHAIGAANEILPLVMILWDEPRRESEGIHESRSMSRDYSSSNGIENSPVGNGNRAPSDRIKEQTREERQRLLVRPSKVENSRRLSESSNPKIRHTKPKFIQILVIHFLRTVSPTLIRRVNICGDGVFIPRSIYLSNGNENGKNNECIICFSNLNDVILLPCRHKLVCRYCVCMIKQCPLCRGYIASYIREGDETNDTSNAEVI